MKHFDIIILGGGISGLTYARLLQKHTNKSFMVMEKESTPGGLCRTKNINGNYFDIGGGHFLYTKHQHVYNFIFSHIPEHEFNRFQRVTKIKIHGTYVDYPLEQNIWQLPKEQQYKYLCSIIDGQKYDPKNSNFKEWILRNLGSEIFDNYLSPYNEKIWGVPVHEMSTDWLYKIPSVDLKDILRATIFRQADARALPSHPYFYYPKEGGFQRITDAIYHPIKEHVRLGEPVASMRYYIHPSKPGCAHWEINDKYIAPMVINTIAWNLLPLRHNHESIKNLHHNSIYVSLKKEDYDNNWQWCYLPDKSIATHREFYVNNYALNNADKCIAYETNASRFTSVQRSESMTYHLNEYAYPIPTQKHSESIKEVINHYGQYNLHGLGRWGQWQYHNSDVCIDAAFKLFEKLEHIKIH